jgi:hypothetical protein
MEDAESIGMLGTACSKVVLALAEVADRERVKEACVDGQLPGAWQHQADRQHQDLAGAANPTQRQYSICCAR